MTMTMMMMIMSWYFLLFCDNGTLNDHAKPSAFHLLCGWRWDEENVTSLVVIVKCHINNFDEWIPLRPFWHCGAVLTGETSLHRITTCKKKIKVWNTDGYFVSWLYVTWFCYCLAKIAWRWWWQCIWWWMIKGKEIMSTDMTIILIPLVTFLFMSKYLTF